MADEIKTEVRQDSYSTHADGEQGKVRLNRRGELVVADQFLQWAVDGRVFNASNAVQETLEDLSETARGSNNVNPALLLVAPSGKTAIPLEIIVDQGLDGTDEDIAFTICTDDANRYSSGGAVITPINMRKDDPRLAGCRMYSGSSTITASANTDDDTIYSAWVTAEAVPKTTQSGVPTLFWSARNNISPVLIGPASLLVFIVSATADQTYNWSIKWAEFDTTEVVA